jgi:hypothetical protein
MSTFLVVLIFEQKDGTSLVKLVLSRRKSGLLQYRLSVPVILGKYHAQIHSDLAESNGLRGFSRETDRTGPKDTETLTDGSGGAWRD